MRQQCRKTCGFCPETCNDTKTNCASSLSYCHDASYRNFLGNACRRSCMFCGRNKSLLAYENLINVKCSKTCGRFNCYLCLTVRNFAVTSQNTCALCENNF
ncbi:unnamed protein product [Enterobius vermicularis]|uniref:ShKT domain-containing protein n=1 Tax=Enterobius vermicularis TaxID=51028 RepID=A0A0N4UTC1_ENTVE|nr:unnamed protein product [Enterobius vermicularis]